MQTKDPVQATDVAAAVNVTMAATDGRPQKGMRAVRAHGPAEGAASMAIRCSAKALATANRTITMYTKYCQKDSQR